MMRTVFLPGRLEPCVHLVRRLEQHDAFKEPAQRLVHARGARRHFVERGVEHDGDFTKSSELPFECGHALARRPIGLVVAVAFAGCDADRRLLQVEFEFGRHGDVLSFRPTRSTAQPGRVRESVRESERSLTEGQM